MESMRQVRLETMVFLGTSGDHPNKRYHTYSKGVKMVARMYRQDGWPEIYMIIQQNLVYISAYIFMYKPFRGDQWKRLDKHRLRRRDYGT